MTLTKMLTPALAVAVAFSGFSIEPVAAGSAIPGKILAPLKAASFNVGSKHALAFYEVEKNACKVTVVVSDPYIESASTYPAAVHFKAFVAAGTAARVETTDGPSLAVTCASGASSMMVQTIDRVAVEVRRQ